MRKITFFLLSLLCAMTVWAQNLLQITSDKNNPIYYTIYNTRSDSPGGLIYYAGDNDGLKDGCKATALEAKYKFYFTGSDDSLYVHNAATTKKLASVNSWTDEGSVWCVIKRNDGNLAFGPKGKGANEQVWWNEQNQGRDGYTTWDANDDGSGFVVELASEFAYPEIGKLYTIEAPLFEKVQGVKKGLVANGGNSLGWNTVDLNDKNYYWTLVKGEDSTLYLQNVGTDMYINGDAVRESPAALTTYALGSNQFNIITNGTKLHAVGHSNGNGSNGGVTDWEGAAGSASAWKFVEYIEITYKFTYNGKDVNVSPQTVTAIVGEEYPNITAQFPYGIKATKPAGKVTTGAETTVTIALENTLPFVPAASYDEIINWYYVKIKDANYLYHKEGLNYIDLNQTTVADDNKDAYSWAFVGNAFDGFQIVNKATGNGYILSSSTDTSDGNTGGNTHPVMTKAPVSEGNNTYWIPSASSYTENGFFLAQKDNASNKMNHRDNKLAYWNGGADKGSTFNVELRLSEAEELIALVEQAEALLSQIGEGVGKCSSSYEGYEETYNEIVAYVKVGEIEEATAKEYKSQLSAIINSFTLNLPETNKYYCIKCADLYVSDVTYNEAYNTTNKTQRVLTDGEPTAKNIFYYNEANALIGYAGGYGFEYACCNTKNPEGMNSFEFKSATDKSGYLVMSSSGTSTAGWADGFWKANNGKYLERVDEASASIWSLEEVETLPVSITEAGYATFFAPVAVEVPAGVEAYTITIDGDCAVFSESSLGVIPANTGVLLKGNTGLYNFAITTTEETATSALRGSVATTYYTTAGTYYALGVVDGVVAFYKDELKNNRFQNNSHKAYLFVAGQQNVAAFSFRFGGNTTAVEEVETESAEAVIYDLSGRRINEISEAGIYIIGGKKVLVK